MKSGAVTPVIWVVVLGWNNAEMTIECLNSLAASRHVALHALYVDNGSEAEQLRLVREQAPAAVSILRLPRNVGVPRAFNAGLGHALRHDAKFIFMANNDTTLEPGCLYQAWLAMSRDPAAGLVQPKIFFDSQPDRVWSAGSRFRRLPPAIVMRQTKGPDDGRFDRRTEIGFSSFCTVLLRAEALKQTGLLDPSYHYLYEDYDLSLRLRMAGYKLRFAPEAKSLHKVHSVARGDRREAGFWLNYGRSHALFCRRHRRFPWLAGPAHTAYLILRACYEGGRQGGAAFRQGLAQGRQAPLLPIPARDDAAEPVEFLQPETLSTGLPILDAMLP